MSEDLMLSSMKSSLLNIDNYSMSKSDNDDVRRDNDQKKRVDSFLSN